MRVFGTLRSGDIGKVLGMYGKGTSRQNSPWFEALTGVFTLFAGGLSC